MIRFELQVSEKEGLATGFVAASVRLNCDEYRVDLGECFGVITLQYPALF